MFRIGRRNGEGAGRSTRVALAIGLLGLPLIGASGCSDMSTSYTIETQQDAQGQEVLVYRTECAAGDSSSSFTVVFTLTGVLGQSPTLPTDHLPVIVAMETADGPVFINDDGSEDGVWLRLGRQGERPVDVGGWGETVRVDADGTTWNTWEGSAHPLHLGLLIGADYVEARYGDIEFVLSDAKLRGIADFLRRIGA